MSSDGKLYKDGTESSEPHIEEFIRLGKCKSFYAFLEIHFSRVEKVLLAGVSFTDLQMGSRRTSFRIGQFHLCI